MDECGNTEKMRKIEDSRRKRLTVNRDVWIIGRYDRVITEIGGNAAITRVDYLVVGDFAHVHCVA